MFAKLTKATLPLLLIMGVTFVALPIESASAAGTGLITETFTNGTLTNQGWTIPSGGTGVCLTAGTSTTATPVGDCQSSGGDSVGSGALRLTDNSDTQVGTIYSNVELPTANGLDVSWTSYQFNGSGADGISFDLAAVNPNDPTPPTAPGPSGGSLGYSTDQSDNGVPYGYLGFGADVYGNYENSQYGGSDCNQSSPANNESMAVRGPGDGLSGYCLLNQLHLSGTYTLDNASATSRGSGSSSVGVPEEVVLNTTGSAVTATASGISVPAGDYLFATEPLNGDAPGTTWSSLEGTLPTNPVDVPNGWLNSSTGLPQELAFGFSSSTGGSTEYHEINLLQASSISAAPVLSLTNTDSGSGTLYAGQSATVTLTPGVDSSSTVSEDANPTVTDTFPSNITVVSATTIGWSCSVLPHSVTCTYSSVGPIAPGTTINPVSIAVTASSTAGPFSDTASVTSSDGAPATATDSGTIVALTPQVITFTNTPPSPAYTGGTYTVTTNGGGASGNPVVLSVDSSSASGCTINGTTGVVTLSLPLGSCEIDANQAGDSTYSAASQVIQAITEVKIPQVVSFTNTAPTSPNGGTTYTVTTNGGGASGNSVVLSVDSGSTSGCSINGTTGVVTLSAPIGTCVIDANQAGNGSYLAATQVQQTVTDVPLAQVINLTNSAPTSPTVNTTYTVAASGGASGNPVTLSVSNSSTSGCTINGTTKVVTLAAPAGTCIIDANQAGGGIYSAAPQVAQTVTSVVIPQAVSFTSTTPTAPEVNSTYTVTSNGGGASGNPVAFSVDSSSTSGCTVGSSSGVVTLSVPAGTCVIDANQAGVAGTYGAAAQVQQTVTSVVIPQALVFNNPPPVHPYVGSSYTVTASGGGASTSVVYSVGVSSTSGCSVNSSIGVVVLSAPAGTCTIDANKAGVVGLYAPAAQIEQFVTSSTIPQAITFSVSGTAPAIPVVGSTYTVMATGGGSGNPVVFSVSSSSTSGCTVNASTGVVTLSAPAGTCIIDANQAGNSTFSPASQVQESDSSVAIPQTVIFDSTPKGLVPGSSYTIKTTGGGSDNPVVLSIGAGSSPGCRLRTVSGITTLQVSGGKCVVDASQAGNSVYSAGSAHQVVLVGRQVQLSLILHYVNNSWGLTKWSQNHLRTLAGAIAKDHMSQVRVDGFASSTGTTNRNNLLGIKRAEVAGAFLQKELSKFRAHKVHIKLIGNGASKFAVHPATAAGNRRTVISVK